MPIQPVCAKILSGIDRSEVAGKGTINLTLANKVTFLRLALIPLNLILLLFGLNGLAALLFLFLSLSDVVDGYIARKYNQVSELGKLIDPLADKILVITVLIALVEQGLASSAPVMLLAAREFIVFGVRVMAAKAGTILPAIPSAKWKTALQLTAVLMLMFDLPFANLALWVAVLLALFSGGEYLWQNRTLLQSK
ncbi:MAG: CDP-diacylglycerol--glycerol-3-phosphate 3-phosphatidyltransferase [Candidatus Margulisbacteria bacterium]|nr:CDP-diacylglycerol--glycerol-3-phosphate 3-phosphatidyltransferase [Candidatus Margulisiibacteriota bacterium]